MTTNYLLYKSVLDQLRKDLRGDALTVIEFNQLLAVVNYEYYAQQYEKFQLTQNITDSLKPFISTATVALTTGAGTLPSSPSDYLHTVGKPTCVETISAVTYTRTIDVITEAEYAERVVDPITQPTTTYPVAVIRGTTITVYPTSITSITLYFLRKPTAPALDYYLTVATNVRTYMAAAGTHTVATPTGTEYYPLAATQPSAGATYASQTVELEWGLQDRPSILNMLLHKCGMEMGDTTIAQYELQQQEKNNKV